jgi:DivIVA domain-containing protein
VQTLLIYVFALLVVGGLLFLAASFAFGRDEEMAPALPEGTPVELPDDRLATGTDLRALRLAVVLRGYRMEEVDWVLDRLAEQVDSRDREIARLRSVLHVEPMRTPGPDETGQAAPAGGADETGRPAGGSRHPAGPADRSGSAPVTGRPDAGSAPVTGRPDAGSAPVTGRPDAGSAPVTGRPDADDPAPAGGATSRPALGEDDERLSTPDEPVPVRAAGDGPVPVRDRERRRVGPGNDPVRGLRPDGGPDRDQR